MELDIDMTCVYNPREYIASALPELQAMIDRYRTWRPTAPTLLGRLMRDEAQLIQWQREFHHATNNAARLQDSVAIANCSRGRDLLSAAHHAWQKECRSTEGRLAFLRAATDEELTPEALNNPVLWVTHGRVALTGWAPVFLRVTFAVPRWIDNWGNANFVVIVPEWFPNSEAAQKVITQTPPTLHAMFPGVTDAIADTFAALWEPLEKNSVYRSPEAAYAAAEALVTPSLAPA